MKQSLLLLAGVAVGCAATAVAQRVLASRSAAGSDDRSADAKKKAPVTFDSALITLEMPDNPSAVRSNRALINAAVKRVRRCVFLAFEGGAPSATSTDVGKKQRVDTSVLVKALGHYDDVNDAALAAGNLHLDCRVLLPVQGLCTERSLWRLPQLEAIFGVPSDELLAIVHQLNDGRRDAGLGQVTFVSLAKEAALSEFEHHIYFDDICGRLPSFPNVVLGGTFDHLHVGHRKLLSVAVLICRTRMVVGVTHDCMLAHKANAHLIQPFDERCRAVRDFVSSMNPALELDIVAIKDIYGPTVSDPSLNAIVVSSETAPNAEKLNEERVRRRMHPMAVISLARVSAVSSSVIRNAMQQHQG